MTSGKFEEIKTLIQKAELENAKSEGVIENIKKEWMDEYGTDDPEKIKEILKEKKTDLKTSEDRLDKLYNDLLNSYDWEQLEEDL